MITSHAIKQAIRDIFRAIRLTPLAVNLGVDQVLMPYRYAIIGPLWILIQAALYTLAISIFFGPAMRMHEPYFATYVTVGFAVFTMLQTLIAEGANVFLRNKAYILNIPNPFFIYPMVLVVKSLFHVSVASIVLIAAIYYEGVPISSVMFLAIPGLLLCVLFGIGAALSLGVITSRLRDVGFASQSIMRLMLFVTPIFWVATAKEGGVRMKIANMNPFYHLIELVRQPLLGRAPAIDTWVIGGALTGLSLLTGFLLFARYRGRIAVWI